VCIKLKLIQCYRENLCQYCACYPLLRAYYPMESHCLAVLGHCHLQGVRRDLLLAGKKNSCEYIYIYIYIYIDAWLYIVKSILVNNPLRLRLNLHKDND
jgi:hypothetical protein